MGRKKGSKRPPVARRAVVAVYREVGGLYPADPVGQRRLGTLYAYHKKGIVGLEPYTSGSGDPLPGISIARIGVQALHPTKGWRVA